MATARREVKVAIVGDASSFSRSLRDATGDVNSFESRMQAFGKRVGDIGMTLTRRMTLPIVGAFALAAKAAADEEAEIAQLDQVLKNNLDMTNKQRAAVEKQITAWQNATGFADGQLRPSLAKLVIAGRSWEQAQNDMTVAMDIARARGISLESVTLAMSKAAQGNTTALGRLGIATKDVSGKTLTFDQILKNASETMGGSAAKYAETTAGKMEILKNKIQDLVEAIGTMLLPIISTLADFLGKLTDKFATLDDTQKKVLVVIGLIIAAIPLLLIAFSAIVAHPIVAGLLAIAGAAALIVLNFDAVKNAAINMANDVIYYVNKAIQALDSIPGIRVRGNIGYVGVAELGPAGEAYLKEHPNAGAEPSGFPAMAAGGIVRKPTFAMIGESGPEAVVPLDKMSTMGGGTVTIPVYVGGKQIAEIVASELSRAGGPKITQRAIA